MVNTLHLPQLQNNTDISSGFLSPLPYPSYNFGFLLNNTGERPQNWAKTTKSCFIEKYKNVHNNENYIIYY